MLLRTWEGFYILLDIGMRVATWSIMSVFCLVYTYGNGARTQDVLSIIAQRSGAS